jgi:ATP-binding cassette subfamily B protein
MTTMGPLLLMTMLSNTWASGIASAGRINEVFDTVPDVADRPGALPLSAPVGSAPGSVVLDGVSFAYDGHGSAPVLDNIRLSVRPGETVAILGATGAGKSTLVNLVPRFYDVTAGRLLVDGHDIRDVRQDSLLGRIAVVPQEAILFSGTVRDNIRYGRPAASEEDVIAAARAAQADDFIRRLPQGYDTRVEERGVNLSGGQKQRIAIARALLTKPAILILDDSTSAVDVETETRIQDALEAHVPRPTTLVVAQRISTVLKADRIVVIDRGRIAAEGRHRDLLHGSAIYREIYDSQLGDADGGPFDARSPARSS